MNAGLFTCHHNCRGYAMLIVAGQFVEGELSSISILQNEATIRKKIRTFLILEEQWNCTIRDVFKAVAQLSVKVSRTDRSRIVIMKTQIELTSIWKKVEGVMRRILGSIEKLPKGHKMKIDGKDVPMDHFAGLLKEEHIKMLFRISCVKDPIVEKK